jgi:hypothetical protein
MTIRKPEFYEGAALHIMAPVAVSGMIRHSFYSMIGYAY